MSKKDRGFASLDLAQRSAIARLGGQAAHKRGTAHEWTSAAAREAGRKGGLAAAAKRRALKQTGAAA